MIRHKITIISYRRPPVRDVNAELQWLGEALGLFSLRDKDKSCFRLFITLLKGARLGHAFSSDELAAHLHLSRATVIHHLNKLMEAGIVLQQNNRYLLRVDSLSDLIEEIRRDLDRALDDLKDVADQVDRALGL